MKQRSVLISDIAELFTRSSGLLKEEKTVTIELPPGKLREEWCWDFNLTATDFNRKKSVLKVAAILF
jgi:hypothetical protein